MNLPLQLRGETKQTCGLNLFGHVLMKTARNLVHAHRSCPGANGENAGFASPLHLERFECQHCHATAVMMCRKSGICLKQILITV